MPNLRTFGLPDSLLASIALLLTLCPSSAILRAEIADEPKPARIESGEPVWNSRPGPWGDLEIRSLYLEAPDSLVAGLRQPNSTIAWNFPDGSEASLAALFERAGLTSDVRSRLLNPQRILIHEGVWTLFAEPAVVEAMTISQRSAIYTELAKSSLNSLHQDPAFVVGDNVDDWLREAHLSGEQKATVKQLIWQDGELLAFSDVSVLLSQAKTDVEVRQIFKFMTRVRTLVVSMKLPHNTNWKPLARYWTGEGRITDSLPLLTSAEERDSVSSIDITHLLPPIARRQLYTFPSLDSAAEGRLPDCQWTALNFFNSVPSEYYLDARLTATHIKEAYESVQAPYQYGDILEFLTAEGNAVHACVYIADDIVFTKNGEGMIKPWVLMWLSSVQKLYLRAPGMQVQGYRLKPSAS